MHLNHQAQPVSGAPLVEPGDGKIHERTEHGAYHRRLYREREIYRWRLQQSATRPAGHPMAARGRMESGGRRAKDIG